MATRLTHRQRPDLQSYTILALGRAFAVTGQAASTLAGRRLTVPDRIPYSYDGYAATLTPGTGDVWNVTPAPTWTEGISAPYDLTATLPSTYTDGGVYSFGYEGTTPPTGLTLSEAGSLDVGTATAATTTGVKFSYYEPGATTTLTLHSQFAGTYPYMATIYPLEGTVPSGQILLSPDDSTFRSSVLSTWPDGSAQVMVGAGRKAVSGGGTTNIKLRPGLASGTNLTTTDLVAVVNTVAVNFGTPLSLTLTTTNHDRIWWQNPEVICARYRRAITDKGVMEAVIDVHCFRDGRAFVEVVIENSKMATASPSKPADQTYTNATVSVNGSPINGSGTSSTWAGGSTHQAFRAWYCSGWVGGDPGIEVTHDTASLWAHPLTFRPSGASPYDFSTYVPAGSQFFGVSQTYGSDVYTPWGWGRTNWNGMGAGGDHRTIGYLPQYECHYIQTGSKHVRRSVIANGLALLSYNFQYRDSTTNDVPRTDQLLGLSYAGGFPRTGAVPISDYNYYEWDIPHSPAVALIPFLCRPSPCFIELAQKITAMQSLMQSNNLYGSAFATRGRAWAARNLGFAIFLTPDSHPFKSPAKTTLGDVFDYYRLWEANAEDKLNVMYGYEPVSGEYMDESRQENGFQTSYWMHCWISDVARRLYNVKILTGADQTTVGAFADWGLQSMVRFINECPGHEWRHNGYHITIGQTSAVFPEYKTATINQFDTWAQARALNKVDSPPATPGPFKCYDSAVNEPTSWASSGWITNNGLTEAASQDFNYPVIFWSGLVAAVEQGVTGADQAWTTVAESGNVTNLSTFLTNGAKDCRSTWWPRNK